MRIKPALAVASATGALLLAGALPASAAGTGTATTTHPYTCSNSGSGSLHIVNCIGTVTGIGNVVKNVDIDVKDVNVLSNNDLDILETSLEDVADVKAGTSVLVQKVDLAVATVDTYVNKLSIPIDISKVLVDIL
ncbi:MULTISPECIES: hypothetical protein [Streptomyces]|uniref:Secreted protein n=1 Tax=Streptomyces lichenis TaxID=2306967 RepID=A0ABT0IKD9_9ACTN|nr:hypothetical protein [Streptomyces lichenis]MCK8681798.1 hypothetical protein [Streptomyces lichenis]